MMKTKETIGTALDTYILLRGRYRWETLLFILSCRLGEKNASLLTAVREMKAVEGYCSISHSRIGCVIGSLVSLSIVLAKGLLGEE